jgi:hypothetical protein
LTNREKILSILGHASPTNAVEGVMIDNDIIGYDPYVKDNLIPVLKAKKSLLRILLSTPDTTNENGYGIKYDRKAIRDDIKDTEDEISGIEGPTLTSCVLW